MAKSRFELSEYFTDVIKYKYKQLLDDLNKYGEVEDDKQIEEIENGIHVYKDVQNKISEHERRQLFDQIGILSKLIQMQNYSSFVLINLIDDKFKSLGDQEEILEILSTVDAKIRTLNEVTAQDLFSIDSLAAPIYGLAGNINYAKMLQDITKYKMRMEQIIMLKAIKNAMEVYKEFDEDKYKTKKTYLSDQILLLFLSMRMHFDPDNRINLEQQYIFYNFYCSKFEEVTRSL